MPLVRSSPQMISASASSWTTVRTTGSTRSTVHRHSGVEALRVSLAASRWQRRQRVWQRLDSGERKPRGGSSPKHTLEEVEMPTDTIWRRLGSISPYVVGDLDLS